MSDVPGSADEALRRLRSLGLADADAQALEAHFADADRRGKHAHGYARIPWLETQSFDPRARPQHLGLLSGIDRWHGAGALGYLVLDGVKYHTLDTKDIPGSCVNVPFLVTENGQEVRTTLTAGFASYEIFSSNIIEVHAPSH